MSERDPIGRVFALSGIVLGLAAASAAAQDFTWQGAVGSGDAVTIRGVNGAVVARAASGNRVSVEAVKYAEDDDPDAVTIEVVEDAEGVLICAVYPSRGRRDNRCARGNDYHMDPNDFDVTVDFTVEVPDGVDLHAVTVNGDVEAIGLTGDVRGVTVNGGVTLESTGVAEGVTVNGSIEARMGTPPRERLQFTTVNGSIRLELPAGTNADIDIETVNGSIETDFPLTIRGRWGPRSASGEIGSGGPRIELETVNGSIEIIRGR